jgi:hypothetical protein
VAANPIKRARKAGAKIPNIGGRPSRAYSATVGQQDPNRPLEDDPALQSLAKRVLRNHAEWAEEEKSRIAAAKALAEVTRTQERKLTLGLEGLSAEQIDRLTIEAHAALGNGTTQ